MGKMSLKILITGAGAPGIRGTIYAIKSNPDKDYYDFYFAGIDIKSEVVGKYFVNKFYKVPPPESEDYINVILDICKKEKIDIVIPQTTREIFSLSKNKHIFDQEKIKVMISDAGAINMANNKLTILETFQRLALPHPKYILARNKEDLINASYELGYPKKPVVIKPPVSNGMRGLRILTENPWDVNRFLNEKPSGVEIKLEHFLSFVERWDFFPELLVSEYLPGPEFTVDAFIGQHVSVAIPRLRKSIRSGISFETISDFRQDLIEYTIKAGKALGLRYAFGFQYKLDENGTPKVLECNPRVQGTMVASVFSGINVIWLAIKELLGQPVTELPNKIKEFSFYRFWGGIGISGENLYEI